MRPAQQLGIRSQILIVRKNEATNWKSLAAFVVPQLFKRSRP